MYAILPYGVSALTQNMHTYYVCTHTIGQYFMKMSTTFKHISWCVLHLLKKRKLLIKYWKCRLHRMYKLFECRKRTTTDHIVL